MSGYNQFVKCATEQYDTLPQEGTQLYKKHFIPIPFELKKYVDAKADAEGEGAALTGLLNWELKGMNVKFDAAIGSDYAVGGNKYLKIKGAETLGDEEMKNRLHESGEDKYIAFIDAYSRRFIFIDVPGGNKANLNLIFPNSNSALNAEVIINVGKGSTLSLFELYSSRNASASSSGTIHEVRIGENSDVEINSLHNETANTVVLGFCRGKVGEGSAFRFNSFYNGGSYVRVRNKIEACGIRSKIDVNELVFGSREQKFDVNTVAVNGGKETGAHLESKAALMDTSFCIFKGFARIEKGAKKSESYVHERGLLLDEGARIDALPDMSVDESDVKAKHSSATAPIDDETSFYLMSRGIGEREVRELIVKGLFAESLSKFNNRAMRDACLSLIDDKIGNGKGPGGDIFKGYHKYRGY